ncbi:MAG: hypothetical protein BWX84_00153 [Verrucomicrobia bacterium ADurb.Bin118]|nr:MAG: hypothetical protein BWX84_00153 [Verrucomicrobia bacterium ADurb.Bin118]
MPQAGVPVGQPAPARGEVMGQYAEQIKVHEPRPRPQQEPVVHEHFLEGQEFRGELPLPLFPVPPPLIEAAGAKLAFLETQKIQLLRRRHKFAPVQVGQAEGAALDLPLDVMPQDRLQAVQLARKQAQPEFVVQILADDLRGFARFKHHRPSVPDDGHPVITLPGQFPDQRTVVAGDVNRLERFPGEFKKAALDLAEGTPRKLNQLNHVTAQGVSPRGP